MANKFVWSGATGANDGSSWNNAYTSLMRDWGVEFGFTPATDYIYVRSVHSETSGATLTIIGSTAGGTDAACRVICVVGDTTGTTPGNLATGASVTTTGGFNIEIGRNIYAYGVLFFANANLLLSASGDTNVTLESCGLKLTRSGTSTDRIEIGHNNSGASCMQTLIACTLDFTNAGHGLDYSNQGIFRMQGGSVAFDIDYLLVSGGYSGAADIAFVGVDLSTLSSSSLVLNTGVVISDQIRFSRCLLASGATLVSGNLDAAGARVESYHCQIGTDADPSYQMEIQDSRGKVSANTAKYRTGGASDGVRSTPISWDFDTAAGSVRGYPGHAFEGPPISAWTPGNGSTAHVYRIAFASDATINDDELWIELEGPNDAATNSLAALKTTRVAPRTTAAAYTTDSGSTWTGTGVGTKQYMQIQYTPDKPGPVVIRVHMAKASDNIYIDPLIQIDP
jgi:hypothetical protein